MVEEAANGYQDGWEDMVSEECWEREANIDDILGDALESYVERMSARLAENTEKLLSDPHTPEYITSREGAADPATRHLHNQMQYLHRNWPYAKAITAREMLTLLRKYLEYVPDDFEFSAHNKVVLPALPALPAPAHRGNAQANA
jgi:hypothetical protein